MTLIDRVNALIQLIDHLICLSNIDDDDRELLYEELTKLRDACKEYC